jgi:hypothetical protein
MRMLVLATAMLALDGTGDPSLHVCDRHTRKRFRCALRFSLSFVCGGNGCLDVLQRVLTSLGNKDFHEAFRFGFPRH